MLILMVNVKVKAGKREQFLEAVKEDAQSTIANEEGNFGFYVVQHDEDPDRFSLFEVYRDQAALDAHRAAPHFLKYREATADLYEEAPVRVMGANVWPPDSAFTK